MGRLMAIDYGRKRCGVAVTDMLQISANGLPTVRSCDLEAFLADYCSRESVDAIIFGQPRQMDGSDSDNMRFVQAFLNRLKKVMPDMRIELFDERFTSVIAHREMLAAGMKKKDRQRKELADEMSAVLILTSYLESRR